MSKRSSREDDVPADILAQTENFIVWTSEEDDETIFHVELDVMTLHFYAEDWDELVTLIQDAVFEQKQQKK